MATELELWEEAHRFATQLCKEPYPIYAIVKELESESYDPGYIAEKVRSAKNYLDDIERDARNAFIMKREREAQEQG